MKRIIKKLFRKFGLEVSSTSSPASTNGQVLLALNQVQANVIFDIGANVGQFAQKLRTVGYTGKIVSFEPLSSAYQKVSKAANSDSQWVVHSRTAIGDLDGEIEINISGNSVSSSVLPILDSHSSAAADSAYVSSETTPLVRLDSIATTYLGADSRLFIKIDTQGFEWQVLDGARETLKSAQGLILELSLVPLYEGQKTWREIVDRLEGEGFMLWAIQKGFIDPRTGQSLQVDAIFLRQ